MTITGTAEGLDTVIAKLNVGKAQISGPLQSQVLDDIGNKGVGILKGYLPRKTGRTRAAVAFSVQGEDMELGLGQTTPRGLGQWLLEGTKMHVIQGSPLRFQGGGSSVYRPRVHHPGTRPIDLTKAVADLESMADGVIRNHVDMLEPQLSD